VILFHRTCIDVKKYSCCDNWTVCKMLKKRIVRFLFVGVDDILLRFVKEASFTVFIE